MFAERRIAEWSRLRPMTFGVLALVLALLVQLVVPGVASAAKDGCDEGATGPYRIGHRFPPVQSVNPASSFLLSDTFVLDRIYEPLVDLRPAGDELLLARRVSFKGTAEGGQVITFSLRRGVQWHDGEAFEADDAAFSLLLARDNPDSALGREALDSVDSVEVVNKHTVRVYSSDPALFTQREIGSVVMLPKHIWEGVPDLFAFDNDPPIGTGPFVYEGATDFVTYEPVPGSGSPITVALTHQLKRFDGYWDGCATMRNLEISAVDPNESEPAPTPAERISSDEFDMWLAFQIGLGNAEVEEANTTPGVNVHLQPNNGFRYLAFNFRLEVTGDPAFRRAMAHLVDREGSLAAAGVDLATIPFDQVVPELFGPWYNPDAGAPGYDPAAAKQILEDAGYFDANGNWTEGPLELLSLNSDIDPVRAQFAVDIAAEARAIGVPLTEKLTDFLEIVIRVFDLVCPSWLPPGDCDPNEPFDMYMLGWGLADTVEHLRAFFHSDQIGFSGLNSTAVNLPELDEALDALVNATTEADSIAASFEAQSILADELPYVVLYQGLIPTFYDPAFKGYREVNGDDWLLNNKTLLKLKPAKNK